VNNPIQETPDAPVWAREDAFPGAPAGWGWVDVKGNPHACDSQDAIAAAIRDDRDGSVTLVWSPAHKRMVLPEELPGMSDALRTARERWTREDLEDAVYKLRWFGAALVGFSGFAFFNGYVWAEKLAAQSGTVIDSAGRLKFALKTMFSSTSVGFALLMFIIFAFIPWYQARKRRRELGKWTEAGIAEAAPTIRFETWLAWQKAPLTKVFLGLIAVVALAQMLIHVKEQGLAALMSIFHNWEGTSQAGLMKDRYLLHGEWWRLFTAPFLHGNVVHLLMNAAALAYLGKRLEVFARWPHLPLVFLFAACVGGEASARFVAAPSVGASGGLMGWLGFLMVFETLHKRLVPRRARRRLGAGVLLTALIGIIGFRYIDNAAHAGGLVAGMLYAAIVFPSSSSPARPRSTVTDRAAGIAAMVILIAAAGLAVVKMMAG
jgi:membrane associated rhomboid family serine protease